MFVEVNNQLYELAWFQYLALCKLLQESNSNVADLEGLILSRHNPLYIGVVLKAPLQYVRGSFKFTVGE